jgi:hypothetical protein
MEDHRLTTVSLSAILASADLRDTSENLPKTEDELLEHYATRLNRLARLPAEIDFLYCKVLAEAKSKLPTPSAFKRLLERIGMSEGEATKRLGLAGSTRISSEEFQTKLMAHVEGYSTLAALNSLTDAAYARLISGLKPGTKVTKSLVASVARGSSPSEKLITGIEIQFVEHEMANLSPSSQTTHRLFVEEIMKLPEKRGCTFKVIVRKKLIGLLNGDNSVTKLLTVRTQ